MLSILPGSYKKIISWPLAAHFVFSQNCDCQTVEIFGIIDALRVGVWNGQSWVFRKNGVWVRGQTCQHLRGLVSLRLLQIHRDIWDTPLKLRIPRLLQCSGHRAPVMPLSLVLPSLPSSPLSYALWPVLLSSFSFSPVVLAGTFTLSLPLPLPVFTTYQSPWLTY